MGEEKMKVIMKQQLIDTVAKKWKREYGEYNSEKHDKIYNKLCALENPTEKQITSIIGNSSWTRNECDECKNDVDVTIKVGNEPDYESNTAWLCFECLQKAVKLALEVS
jgi:hypothetical protein